MERGVASGYLHGFGAEEQERLYYQARFLEPHVFREVDFTGARRLLEVGCGVGAETEILLERFPALSVTGVDAAASQLVRARGRLGAGVVSGRARFVVADALRLPMAPASHDAAFVCWFLEHVKRPADILREVARVLAPGSRIYCVEVFNSSFHVEPEAPALMRLWGALNQRQREIGGDPEVGAKLGNYLVAAGFAHVETHVRTYFFDSREPELRAGFVAYWTSLLLSAVPGLRSAGLVDAPLVESAVAELGRVRESPDGVFFYSWVEARALTGRA